MTDGLIVSAGIDYISATMNAAVHNSLEWFTKCNQYLETIAREGNETKAARRLGYDGFSVGGCFVGSREGDYFCQISGERAQAGFDVLYSPHVHYSRLDVQCTVQLPVEDTTVAAAVQRYVDKSNAKLSSSRQRDAILIQSLKKGATCYVGSRKSDQFGRVYNKAAETNSSDYKNCWRYEVELHNHIATRAATLLRLSEYLQSQWAATFVRQWLRHRGIPVPFSADAELQALPGAAKHLSDVETRLKWLEEQVRPAIRRLLKLGLRDTVMAALGLDDEQPDERPKHPRF
jgi:hypothetical protein